MHVPPRGGWAGPPHNRPVRSDTFDFEIPPRLIAQVPAARRDASRLLVVRRAAGALEHRTFAELPALLAPGDLLVLNDTRVRPCRLHCRREHTGGHVELFLLKALPGPHADYEALTGSWSNARAGMRLELPGGGGFAELLERLPGGAWRVRLPGTPEQAEAWVRCAAAMPLPPYIRRHRADDTREPLDRQRYQTVFAARDGAVAAPTAGLHFTPEVLQACAKVGIARAFVTLHVGLGTFRPLKAETVQEHDMHAEEYDVPEATAAAVAACRARKGRVVAVGTTACRTLETVADATGSIRAGKGETRLLICPPWQFRAVDALLTNFHLPRSTLIFLVAAYLGVDLTRRAYEEAIAGEYRFFSYGDAMLCLP